MMKGSGDLFLLFLTPRSSQAYIPNEEYAKYRGTGKKPFIQGCKINFSSKDIKYLIVATAKDISPPIQLIRKTKGLTKSSEETKVLATKILNIEQLEKDF